MKVLLADDHAIFREGLVSLLTAHHVTVIGEARDGVEAFEMARKLHPDVILMDIQMPRCDGLAATRLIKAEMPEIKIVMLTMIEDDISLFDAIKSGASGYLLKRVGMEEFMARLLDLEAGRTPFSPGLAAKVLEEFARLAHGRQTTSETAPVGEEPIPELTARQMQVLTLVARGESYEAIGAILGLSERTIKYHMTEILDRLHLENRGQVMAYAAKRGFSGVDSFRVP